MSVPDTMVLGVLHVRLKQVTTWLLLMMMSCAIHAQTPSTSAPATPSIQQAFLIQNSGWMEPFYADPASQLKPLVAAVATAAAGPQDAVFALAFNQSTPTNVSPAMLYQGQGASGVAAALTSLGVARKGPGLSLADTDFQEAVTKVITGPFGTKSGIIWIFTNNKNSPNNDAQTAQRNLDFYRLVHLEPSITKTLVFPLKMPVQGQLYSARGLMVYALAYGQPAAQALDAIMTAGRLSQVLTRPPARLKPIDQDAVRIVPQKVDNAQNLQVLLASDQRTLVLQANAGQLVPTLQLNAQLQNLFYPYMIVSAKVSASLSAPGVSPSVTNNSAIPVQPAQLTDLMPNDKQQVTAQLSLPMAQIPSAWSPQAMAAMGKQVSFPMTVNIALTEQKLGLAPSFAQELSEIFPGDPISEMFLPPAQVKASQAQVPLLVQLQYPLTPVILLIAGVLALVVAVIALGLVWGQSTAYELMVDGVRRKVVMKRFAQLPIKDNNGNLLGVVKRGLGSPSVVRAEAGHTLEFKKR